jgi:hypothetical protein
MPARVLAGAMCVQRFDDSLDSAIHITYRISLRSSSMPEPRDPLLKVLIIGNRLREATKFQDSLYGPAAGTSPLAWGGCGPALGPPAEATLTGMFTVVWESFNSVMIPPLVHQRRPCYDFYFL